MVEQIRKEEADVGSLGPPVYVDAAHRVTVIQNQLGLL